MDVFEFNQSFVFLLRAFCVFRNFFLFLGHEDILLNALDFCLSHLGFNLLGADFHA